MKFILLKSLFLNTSNSFILFFIIFHSFLNSELLQLERGFKFAKRIPPNELEKRVQLALKNAMIPFEMHARVNGSKRDYNVDFAVPDAKAPSVIIEVVQTDVVPKKKANYRHLICLVDHKFQMLKAKHPNVFTVLLLHCQGPPLIVDRVKEMVEIETLNADAYIIREGELNGFNSKTSSISPVIREKHVTFFVFPK